jgi:hypothetical protein
MNHAAGYALVSTPEAEKAPDPLQSVSHGVNAFIYSWNESLHVPVHLPATSFPNGKKTMSK